MYPTQSNGLIAVSQPLLTHRTQLTINNLDQQPSNKSTGIPTETQYILPTYTQKSMQKLKLKNRINHSLFKYSNFLRALINRINSVYLTYIKTHQLIQQQDAICHIYRPK